MKTFMNLEVGDTLYNVIYANDSGYPLKVRKEKITAIEAVTLGTIIKTADLNDIGGYHHHSADCSGLTVGIFRGIFVDDAAYWSGV